LHASLLRVLTAACVHSSMMQVNGSFGEAHGRLHRFFRERAAAEAEAEAAAAVDAAATAGQAAQ
jgi:hypothetical protein